jgi:hypothetical protein
MDGKRKSARVCGYGLNEREQIAVELKQTAPAKLISVLLLVC